jgi:AAA+ ATPase superfamily predicted ATPase
VVVVIDELPYLVESDAGVPADIQEAWDRELRRRAVLLVCIGSDTRMMRALTQHPAELFGRPTREMVVRPFSPRDLAELSHLDAIGAFDRYLIVGGLPMIARSWPDRSSRRHYLERALADSSSPLVIDGMRILDAEFPGELQARRVLEAIGCGERTFTAISAHSGVANHAGLTTALNALTAKGIVDVRLPYAAPPGRKNKRYVVADPYLRFWLRFVGPSVDEIDRGRGDLPLERIERDWPTFRGIAIEPLVRRSLERVLPDPRFGEARYVGGYWTRTNVPEVDLVGAAEREPSAVSFVGSIKWRENAMFSRADSRRLVEQRGLVPGAADARLVGVSRRGFAADAGLDVEVSPDELLQAWPEP